MWQGGRAVRPVVKDNALNVRSLRWRLRFGALSWKYAKPTIEKAELVCLDKLSPAQISMNTTAIPTPRGLVRPPPTQFGGLNYDPNPFPAVIESLPGQAGHAANARTQRRLQLLQLAKQIAAANGLTDWKDLPKTFWQHQPTIVNSTQIPPARPATGNEIASQGTAAFERRGEEDDRENESGESGARLEINREQDDEDADGEYESYDEDDQTQYYGQTEVGDRDKDGVRDHQMSTAESNAAGQFGDESTEGFFNEGHANMGAWPSKG
ncbi:hypothetical protein MMC24_004629 [Lignoscripta atroalba]|nr:hypothetical protein [Lignoscripta atroalba]